MPVLFDEIIRSGGLQTAEKRLLISDSKIEYKNEIMDCKSIVQVSETLTEVVFSGIKTADTYQFEFEDVNGKQMIIGMTTAFNPMGPLPAYNKIHSALNQAVYGRLVSEMRQNIERGQTMKKVNLFLKKEGIEIIDGLIFKKKYFIPWQEVEAETKKGALHIHSKKDPKAKAYFFLYLWNAIIFREYILQKINGNY